MPRKYDMSLLDNMKKGQYKTNYKDVDVLVKPIPEGGKDGDVDPRLFKSMKMLPLILK